MKTILILFLVIPAIFAQLQANQMVGYFNQGPGAYGTQANQMVASYNQGPGFSGFQANQMASNYNLGPVNIHGAHGNQFHIPTFNQKNYGNVNYGPTNLHGVTGSTIGIGKRRRRSSEEVKVLEEDAKVQRKEIKVAKKAETDNARAAEHSACPCLKAPVICTLTGCTCMCEPFKIIDSIHGTLTFNQPQSGSITNLPTFNPMTFFGSQQASFPFGSQQASYNFGTFHGKTLVNTDPIELKGTSPGSVINIG